MRHSPATTEAEQLQALFRQHGDRTSSLATLGAQFRSFFPPALPRDNGSGLPAGQTAALRVLETPGALIAASEPLAPLQLRAEALAALAAHAGPKRCVAMPVGQALAGELQQRGFSIWQIGAEPVFRLAECFSLGQDPLTRHPVARALTRRGAEVRAENFSLLPAAEAEALRAEMREVAARWLEDKDCLPLGFLAQVEPFAQEESKRYFTLRVRGQLQAFLAAAPFCRQGRALGYYFQDMPRLPEARAGVSELLIVEAMRLLHAEGVAEARLGMAPLAHIHPSGQGAGLLRLLYRSWRWGYNFRSLADFKAKLAPTAWEPLFLASTCPSLATALADALRAHFPDGLLRPLTHLAASSGGLSLKPEAAPVLAGAPNFAGPGTLGQLLRRTRITCALVLLFVGLHLGRLHWAPLDELFRRSGYVPGNVTWEGLFLGPLFHNHWFHLTGDQLSFLAFGALIEALLGPGPYLLLLGAGLWLSNPLTHALCWALLAKAAPNAWAATLAEVDYGSSNAVFAMAGALAALLRQWRSVLLPFAVYGLFICLARHSWLALHHLLTLGLGYACVLAWMALRRQPKP